MGEATPFIPSLLMGEGRVKVNIPLPQGRGIGQIPPRGVTRNFAVDYKSRRTLGPSRLSRCCFAGSNEAVAPARFGEDEMGVLGVVL